MTRPKPDLVAEFKVLQEANQQKLKEAGEMKEAHMKKTLALEKQLLEMAKDLKAPTN